jgi:hypothetical protein
MSGVPHNHKNGRAVCGTLDIVLDFQLCPVAVRELDAGHLLPKGNAAAERRGIGASEKRKLNWSSKTKRFVLHNKESQGT